MCPPAIAAETEGETGHFHYRLAPEFPTIEYQRGDLAFGFGRKQVLLSEDNGKTWPHRADFADAANITFSCILGNGNIIFATQTKLYLSTDKLKSHREITVKKPESGDE